MTHMQDPYLEALDNRSPIHAKALLDVAEFLHKAVERFPTWNSAHEGYGKIAEEFRELEQHVFMKEAARDPMEMRKEALQLAACAIRFAADIVDMNRYRD